jgi:hypothetical protein
MSRPPYFFKYLILTLVYAESVFSLRFINQNFNDLETRVPFNITWEEAEGPVILTLAFLNWNKSNTTDSVIIAGKASSKIENTQCAVLTEGLLDNVTDSQFLWTPPNWVAEVYGQSFSAQDTSSTVFSENFTIANGTSNEVINTSISRP